MAIPLPLGPVSSTRLAAKLGAGHHGPEVELRRVAPLEDAGPDDLAFLDRGRPGHAGCHLARAPLDTGTTLVVADPLGAFCDLLEELFPPEPFQGAVHPTAEIGLAVTLHPGVVIGPRCVVGDHSVLYPNVVLYPGTRVGTWARIHANTTVGADGFRYHPGPRGARKVPQVGGVVIGHHVELGAGCTIDRGFLTDTVLGDGCKLDNQVHVGHNCKLGRSVIIAAQTGLSGSCVIGDGAMLGGQVGLAERTVVGTGAKVGAQSGLHGEVPPGETWLGTPALPIGVMRRVYGLTADLPAMWKAWRERG